MSKGHKVFVYGSLMRGSYNHGLLAGAHYMGSGRLTEPAMMFDGAFPRFAALGQLDKFPVLLAAAGRFAGQIAGELYRVNAATLAKLDELEGVPYHYTRERLAVRLHDGRETMAGVYRIVDPARYFKFLKPVPPVDGIIKWGGPDYART